MYTLIPPSEFKQIPWKNAKGMTTELAINDGGTLDDFNWRLSIASVVEDGEFSNFSGYWRDLVLISGAGLSLEHIDPKSQQSRTDNLSELLQISSFDGGYKTTGKLVSGEIKDFNIMIKADKYQAKVCAYTDEKTVKVRQCDIAFVYAVNSRIELSSNNFIDRTVIDPKHLVQIDSPTTDLITISGAKMIVIELHRI